jgi:GNAT superfamily N-acetyltransferase
VSTDIQSLVVTPLGVDDDAIAAAYRVEAAARAYDVPDFPPICRHRHAGVIRHPWPGTQCHRFLARLDGHPVGVLNVEFTTLDNLDNAFADLIVDPAYRRRGVGRTLYQRAVEVTLAGRRKRLMGNTVGQLPGGPIREGAGGAFATAMGASPALHEIRRNLQLSDVDEAALDRLLADAYARAEGYSLVQWSGFVPDEYVDDVAVLAGRMVTDAPMGDLAWEKENIDAERVRADEAIRQLHGSRRYATGMRNDATGHLVALSTLALFRTVAHHAWQGITLVHPADRGHRLGTIVKIENLRYTLAHEPALKVIDTWNAEVNSYMISINDAMGFRPLDAWIDWQQDLTG